MSLKNKKGFSLVNAMIFTVLVAAGTIAVLNMVNLSNQSQRSLDQKVASLVLTNDILSVLSNSTACVNTVAGTGAFAYDPTVSPTTLTGISNIKNDSNVVMYRTFTDSGGAGLKYQNNLLKINTISIYNYVPSSTPSSSSDAKFYTGSAKMKIEFAKADKTSGSQVFLKELTLAVTLTNGGANDKKISTCVGVGAGGAVASSGGGGGGDVWTTLTDTTGIYYAKNIYIGAAAPTTTTVPFEMNVVDNNLNTGPVWTVNTDPVFQSIKTTSGSKYEIRSALKDVGMYLAFADSVGEQLRIIPSYNNTVGTTYIARGHSMGFYQDTDNNGSPVWERFWFTEYEGSPKGLIGSSIEQSYLRVTPVVTQTGSAGYNGILVNTVENTFGSGQKNLLKFSKGSSDIFAVNSNGSTIISDGTANPSGATWSAQTTLEVRKASSPVFYMNNGNLNGWVINPTSPGGVWFGTNSNDGGLNPGDLILGSDPSSMAYLAYTFGIFVKASTGRVGIGAYSGSIPPTPNPAYPLDVTGDVNTSTCFRVGATTVGGTCTSDERLKEDIKDFDLGLKELMKMQPRRYKFNGLGEVAKSEEETVGFIAQELEPVSPELVGERAVKMHAEDTDKTMVKTVNYSKIIYVVINAVKEFYQEFIKEAGDLRQKIQTAVLAEENDQRRLASLIEENKKLKQEISDFMKAIDSSNDKNNFCSEGK